MATDSSGNIYVADASNNTIRKITPAGAVTTLAGLAGTAGSADGIGSAARFKFFVLTIIGGDVATDSSGNVYVADAGNSTIRKITPTGAVTTLAGLAGHAGNVDGTGSAALFYLPVGVATDSSGNVYVADYSEHTIRKITPAGVVTTLAGLAGTAGSADGTGSAARFYSPSGVATDSSGNIYVADSGNSTIRKITPAGVVTTLAGVAGTFGSADGTGSAAQFGNPYGVATDSAGNVYVADSGNNTIRKITPAGVVTTLAGLAGSLAGNVDGTGSAARFDAPNSVAVDSNGNVYVADTYDETIRKITPAGVVTTLAGLADFPGGSADGTGSTARFYDPGSVATDSSGNVYVADTDNDTIRKITPAGVVTTLAGAPRNPGSADGIGSAAQFYGPAGVATDGSGNVYVADRLNDTIRKISPAGVVTTLAGLAGFSGSADGTGSAARFFNPIGVATDSSGNVYVGDADNNTIRMITPAGVVTTLAGVAGSAGSADGTGSAARFYTPSSVATDSSGNVYVADLHNDTIRKITPAGVVTTLAGLAGVVGSTDGTGTAATFYFPSGVATDSSGNVYVADTDNDTIRKITPSGVVTTLAGLADVAGTTDGTGSAALFNTPYGIAIDSSGNVYIADRNNTTIRLGRAALADVATIDLASSSVGVTRRLGTSPSTATSWQWSVIRRPVDSVADPSNASIQNPTFVPDVPGLFRFRLIASAFGSASISTVDFTSLAAARNPTSTTLTSSANPSTVGVSVTFTATVTNGATGTVTFKDGTSTLATVTVSGGNATYATAALAPGTHSITAFYGGDPNYDVSTSSVLSQVIQFAAPAGLLANATSRSQVALTWSAVAGANHYEVARSFNNGAWSTIGAPSGTSWTDGGLTANTTYLYKVRAIDGFGNPSAYSSLDPATTILFTDDPLVARSTVVKSVHLVELRTAVNAMRASAGLTAATFTDPSISSGSTIITVTHINELRTALDAARSAIGLHPLSYTDPTLTIGVTLIKAAHAQELRDGTK